MDENSENFPRSKLHGVAFSQRVAEAPPALVGNRVTKRSETAVEIHLSHELLKVTVVGSRWCIGLTIIVK